MDIRVYAFSGIQLAYTDKVISAYCNPEFSGIGSAEYHFDNDNEILEAVLSTPFLLLEQDSRFMTVVIGHTLDERELVLFCRTLSFFTSKSILPPLSFTQKTISEMVAECLSKTIGVAFELSSDCDSFLTLYDFKTESYTVFENTLERILRLSGAGFECTLDKSDGTIKIRLIAGRTLSKYISKSDNNAESVTRQYNVLSLAGGGAYRQRVELVDEGWNAYSNIPVLVDCNPDNFAKCYKVTSAGTQFGMAFTTDDYIYCRTKDGKLAKSDRKPDDFEAVIDSSETDNLKNWYTVISSAENESEAAAELSKCKISDVLEADIRNMTYGTDYFLGDTFRIQFENSKAVFTYERKITAVEINDDINGHIEKPKFEEVE